jgi:hypothetical protein
MAQITAILMKVSTRAVGTCQNLAAIQREIFLPKTSWLSVCKRTIPTESPPRSADLAPTFGGTDYCTVSETDPPLPLLSVV